MTGKLRPLHPGEVLREEFMSPLGLSAGMVARAIGVPRTRIERIVAEHTGVSADTAIRLGMMFGTSPQFWMNAQAGYDLEIARASMGEAARRIKLVTVDGPSSARP